jgi:cell wall-associated NlpC family hydrolase
LIFASACATGGSVTQTAQNYLGSAYKYGGTGAGGYDCSGFVRHVYAQHGVELPRMTRDQIRVGRNVPWSRVVSGDLLFFEDRPGSGKVSHVAIALPDGKMIHASTGRKRVVIDDREIKYYQKRRLQVRRVLP